MFLEIKGKFINFNLVTEFSAYHRQISNQIQYFVTIFYVTENEPTFIPCRDENEVNNLIFEIKQRLKRMGCFNG